MPIHGGCEVNGRSATGGGVLDPGPHQLTFDCGGGVSQAIDITSFDADTSWTLTIGPG